MRRILLLALAAALPCLAMAADRPAYTGAPVPEVQPAAPIAKETTDDKRRSRNYPDQPPVIPHAIRDYQLDLNANKCLTCHGRENTEASQAPMISITHFQDREGQTLGAVSPRRYFCTQCHVPQSDARPRIDNLFQDVDRTIRNAQPTEQRK
ncbi:nitrate reductase cytochrome c-type subunit [Arenibaculum pallidiluteum]|uniref:nitrate reductase cytochrome c-type subunit n=1 Tax=Arenibaculum pallidiluteum TaxID=2812559 RepID=UPI001A96EEA1|nr:nitrate reductase cytochrome c-type subunit [Arenibaculum pallidiluteum]